MVGLLGLHISGAATTAQGVLTVASAEGGHATSDASTVGLVGPAGNPEYAPANDPS
jgi:hypothetical protein